MSDSTRPSCQRYNHESHHRWWSSRREDMSDFNTCSTNLLDDITLQLNFRSVRRSTRSRMMSTIGAAFSETLRVKRPRTHRTRRGWMILCSPTINGQLTSAFWMSTKSKAFPIRPVHIPSLSVSSVPFGVIILIKHYFGTPMI